MLFFNACAQLRNEEALKLGKQVLSHNFSMNLIRKMLRTWLSMVRLICSLNVMI